MFENIINFFKKLSKKEKVKESSNTAKERLHLVLMQDRANVSADFLELIKQEIIEVIKKYIDIDEKAIDVKLTNKPNEDGTMGAPALYANIPIITIKNEARKVNVPKQEEVSDQGKEQTKNENNQEKAEEEKQAETVKVENCEEAKQEESKNVRTEVAEESQGNKELEEEKHVENEEETNSVDMQENNDSISKVENTENQELEQKTEDQKQEQTENQTEEQETKA